MLHRAASYHRPLAAGMTVAGEKARQSVGAVPAVYALQIRRLSQEANGPLGQSRFCPRGRLAEAKPGLRPRVKRTPVKRSR